MPRAAWSLAIGLTLAALAYAFPLPGASEAARRLAAILALVASLWVGEALPLAVTALLGPCLCVLFGVTSAERAFAAFGNPIMMLFIGSFLLARATFKYRLNERIAYRVLSLRVLRNDPTRAFVFLALTTATLSAWMSNTAVTAMMLPIAQSVLLAMRPADGKPPRRYASALMLIVAYSASLGGLFTPIGTPPNLIGLGMIQQATGVRITFDAWILRVFPITFFCLLLMIAYFIVLFRHERAMLRYDRQQMVERYSALGPWLPVERRVIAALLCTVSLWTFPPLVNLLHPVFGTWLAARIPEGVAPLIVAGVLFWIGTERSADSPRVLTVEDLGDIDWPVIVLFGGGMCLGALMIDTGFARALGETLASYVPHGNSPWLVLVACLLAIGVSETTSNTASANMVIPVVVAITAQVGGNPIAIGLAATVACTFGFMLPVSTPTNALAYSTGCVTQREMIRYGTLLDLVGALLLSLWFGFVVRW